MSNDSTSVCQASTVAQARSLPQALTGSLEHRSSSSSSSASAVRTKEHHFLSIAGRVVLPVPAVVMLRPRRQIGFLLVDAFILIATRLSLMLVNASLSSASSFLFPKTDVRQDVNILCPTIVAYYCLFRKPSCI